MMEEIKRDADLERVMHEDGVGQADIHGAVNRLHTRLGDLTRAMGSPPWAVRVVYTDRMSAVLICQNPGEGNRAHFHPDDDEWWVVLQGEIQWRTDRGTLTASKDDLVFVPRKSVHKITVVGQEPAIRLAIGRPDVEHVFVDGRV